jgi:hypothetical protein
MYVWLYTEFVLVTRFIHHLYTQIMTTLYNSLFHTVVFLVNYSLHYPLPGNGFQRRTFPLLWVPELSPCLSYKFLRETAHNYWTWVLWLTPRMEAISHKPPSLPFTGSPSSELPTDVRFTSSLQLLHVTSLNGTILYNHFARNEYEL